MRQVTAFRRISAGALVMCLAACARPPLTGTIVVPAQAAPSFTLTDQHGAAFTLADTRGKAVLVSFIYTHCTDLCPYMTMKVKDAIPLLGTDADKVVLVAITTDPERDTVPVIDAYSREAGLQDAWHFLTGTPAELRQVWAAYGVGVQEGPAPAAGTGHDQPSTPAESLPPPTQGLGDVALAAAGRLIDAFGGGYEVAHTAPFWFIDPRGRVRIVMDAGALPAAIASNLKALLQGA